MQYLIQYYYYNIMKRARDLCMLKSTNKIQKVCIRVLVFLKLFLIHSLTKTIHKMLLGITCIKNRI